MTTETTRPDAALVVLVVWLLAELARRTPRRRNARRDAQIVALRRGDRQRWTYRQLAGRFGLTADAVRKVCKRAGL